MTTDDHRLRALRPEDPAAFEDRWINAPAVTTFDEEAAMYAGKGQDLVPFESGGVGWNGGCSLDAAALEAVRRWRYRPTLLNGRRVSVLMTVTVRFQLRRL